MKRGELKALIKECVVEVLQDGLGTSYAAKPVSRTGSASARRSPQQERNHPMDNVSYRMNESRAPAPPPVSVNTNLTQDPVLQSIFQDTASSTLQEQVASERRGAPITAGSDRAPKFMAEHEPDEIFDGASNWEKLAFDI